MNRSKEKCKVLKAIRKNIADALGIDLHQRECTFEGECSGTCPKCQQEERVLNQALLSKTAMAAGLVTMSLSLAACSNFGMVAGEAPEMTTPTPTPICEEELEGEVPDETREGEVLEGDVLDVSPPEDMENISEE